MTILNIFYTNKNNTFVARKVPRSTKDEFLGKILVCVFWLL